MRYFSFILLTVALNAGSQILLKYGVNSLGAAGFSAGTFVERVIRICLNPWVILGAATLVLSLGSYLYLLSKVDLSFAYPFMALAYVFVAVLAWLLFGETLNTTRLIGIALVIGGTFFIAQSSSTRPPAITTLTDHSS